MASGNGWRRRARDWGATSAGGFCGFRIPDSMSAISPSVERCPEAAAEEPLAGARGSEPRPDVCSSPTTRRDPGSPPICRWFCLHNLRSCVPVLASQAHRAECNSAAEGYRFAGFFCRQRVTDLVDFAGNILPPLRQRRDSPPECARTSHACWRSEMLSGRSTVRRTSLQLPHIGGLGRGRAQHLFRRQGFRRPDHGADAGHAIRRLVARDPKSRIRTRPDESIFTLLALRSRCTSPSAWK